MLYLTQSVDEAVAAPERRIPLAEPTALRLERALLSSDLAARRRELAQALADDRALAGWALRTAEFRLGRTINRVDEAADWLCGRLESELAASVAVDQPTQSHEIEWRLPALVTRLGACERQLGDFHRMLEHEKLESLKELAYGASHEINNPLANIAARAQTLLEDETDPVRQRKLSAIHRQAMRAHEMIADLMLFARPPKLCMARVDLCRLVENVVAGLADLAREYDVQITCDTGSDPIILLADDTQLSVAVHAVVLNALEAVSGGGCVFIALRQIVVGDKAWAEIAVRDNGPGISDDVRQNIFDPFFSGREAGRGLGFGLSKCWRIVTDHGGRVIVERPAEGGAEFKIVLPEIPAAAMHS